MAVLKKRTVSSGEGAVPVGGEKSTKKREMYITELAKKAEGQ